MSKVTNLDDVKYVKFFNALPKLYNIIIERKTKDITSADEIVDEYITWDIDTESLDNEVGHAMIFNHLLTIIHYIINDDPELRDQLKEYIKDELLTEMENDSNFNK